MQEFTKSQKSRMAIRAFKIISDAFVMNGYYKPAGRFGQTLERALRDIHPEIYGAMNDPRITELKGLLYVLDRLPKGIESCSRIILSAGEELENTQFEKIIPPKRKRTSYRISEREICFVITRGISEIYDILSHLTFLNIEANKLYNRLEDVKNNVTPGWYQLDQYINPASTFTDEVLERALWDLSLFLGTSFHETKDTYFKMQEIRQTQQDQTSLFAIIYRLVKRVELEKSSPNNEMIVSFTPALRDLLTFHESSRQWANVIHEQLTTLNLLHRPLHIISANLHSVFNSLYGYAACHHLVENNNPASLIAMIQTFRAHEEEIKHTASRHGFIEITDHAGTYIGVQIIDTSALLNLKTHPDLSIDRDWLKAQQPVILVFDYAFGEQAFEIMDDLLKPILQDNQMTKLNVQSISIIGKAGILTGKKGDIMLTSAHVFEGTPHNYIVDNDLTPTNFGGNATIFVGPMITVLGTSLQNRDLLKKFARGSWQAIGLEMEGGHYQRAINAAIIRGRISKDTKVRYAYYASDNPLHSGGTLASGGLGVDGIKPTYLITQVILEKILNPAT